METPMPRTAARPVAERLRSAVALTSAAAVGYAMVGYPLLMAARARFAPRPVDRDPQARPSLTVLVPAHNEADVIARKLDSVLAIDYPRDRLEVLVVDDGSEDGTGAIVQRYAARGVRLVSRSPRTGKMAALNAGVGAASGDLVLLTDASATFGTQAVLAAVAPFADPTVGVVSGQNLIRGGGGAVEQPAGLYWRYQERLRAWESASGSTVGVTGNLFVFRRADHRRMPEDTINDEFAIAMDIAGRGRRVLYEADAVAVDEASASMSEEMARRTRINAGRFQSVGRHCGAVLREPSMLFRLVSHKVLRPVVPLFLIALAMASLLRRATGGPWRGPLRAVETGVLAPGQVALYGAAAVGAALERAGRPMPKIVSVPYFFVSSNIAALGGLLRFARGSQSVMWRKRSSRPARVEATDVVHSVKG
jgi:poly-beta-1,6-N-acetyl-D-glucosamine synthase